MGNITSSSTETNLSDSDNDSCELSDVKLFPYLSTFVQERQENVRHPHPKKIGRSKYDYQSVTLGDEYVDRVASTLTDKSNLPQHKSLQQENLPGRYLQNVSLREHVPTEFKAGCLLPEFPELRDSYDQFCTTLSEYSSREELEAKRSMKCLDETETSCSKYFPDELPDGLHSACKRRKKSIMEEASGAHEKYQRWSMPEFTKLWYEMVDSDSESGIIERTASTKEHEKLLSSYTLPEFLDDSVVKSDKSNGLTDPCHPSLSRVALHPDYTDLEEQISGTKDSKDRTHTNGKLIKESVSCPDIVSGESSSNFCPRLYDSSGFCDSSDDSSVSFSPVHSHTRLLVETESENSHYTCWHETEFHDRLPYMVDSNGINDINDSGLEASSSNCEASVCASDSGYSGMSNGTRDSPEGEEQDTYDHYGDKSMDIFSKPELFKTLKDFQEKIGAESDSSDEDDETSGGKLEGHILECKGNSARGIPLTTRPHTIDERTICERQKSKRCTELMKEFRVNMNTRPGTTCNYSLYRTYEV